MEADTREASALKTIRTKIRECIRFPQQEAQTTDAAPTSGTSGAGDIAGIAKGVESLFGGFMGKPKSEPAPADMTAAAEQGGVIFQSRSEVKKVEVTSLDDTLFEVPASFATR